MTKHHLLLVVLLCSATHLLSQTPTFHDVRSRLERVYTRTLPDGTRKVAKQFKRWEWYWESRTMPDGTLPTGEVYLKAWREVQMAKGLEQAQSKPEWKLVGPTAPDLPSQNPVWNGIGRVNCVAFHPTESNVMFLGSASGGIWKTTDGGTSWTEVMISAIPQTGYSDIAIAESNPQIMYAASGDANASLPGELSGYPGFTYGVLKSTDAGQTWNQTGFSVTPEQNGVVARLWVDPRNQDVVVAATYNGMRRTENGGSSWTTVLGSLAFRDVVALENDPNVLIASTFNLNGGAAVYRSTDNGVSWSLVQTMNQANRIRFAVTGANASMVGAIASLATTNGLDDVYISTDGGRTFTARNVTLNLLGWSATGNDAAYGGQGFYDLALAIDPTNQNNWIMGGVNNWRSTDAGKTWILSSHWVGQNAPWVHADHHHMAYHPTLNRLYDCNDGGIARSTDRGVSWRDISKGLGIQQYYGLAVTEGNSVFTLCGSQDNGTARTLNGKDFQHVLDGDGMASAIDYFNSSLMYASQPNGTFYRSTTTGTNWRIISTSSARGEPGAAWVAPIVTDPSNPSRLYVGYTQVYRSDNGGTTWTRLGNLGVSQYLRKIAVAPSNSNYLYAGFSNSMFRSTDGGTNWLPVSGVTGFIQDIKVDPENPGHAFVAFGGFSPGAKIMEITNGVATNITGNGLPNVPANAVAYQPGPLNRLFIGTDVGVYFKDEGSSTWELYGVGLPTTVVSGMELLTTSEKLRISTYGRGIWEVDANQCVAEKPVVSVAGPTEFCVGDSVVLSAPDGYAVYRWSNGASTRSITLSTAVHSGKYTVTVEDGDGCRAVSDTTAITIKRSPSKPFVTLRGPDTLRTTALGGIQGFQWFFEGQAIPGATERECIATKNGTYTVLVTNADGCSAISDPFAFSGSALSVQDVGESSLAVWPNPTTDWITIDIPEVAEARVKLVSLGGQVVADFRSVPGKLTMNLENIVAAGTYVLTVDAGNRRYSRMIVKR